MFRTPNTLAICLGALLLGAATPPPAAGALQALAHDMTYGWATAHPLFATELGLSDEDGRLDTPSLAENAADLATIRNWEARLAAIPLSDASLHDRDDAALLGAQLVRRERSLTIYGRTSRDYAAPAEDIVDALFTQFQHLPVPSPAAVAGNGELELAWQRIVSRLRGAPAYIAAGEALVTSPGHLQGIIGSQELAGAPDFLSGALTNAAKAQLSAAEFAQFALARDRTLRAIAAAKSFIDAHVAAWPENFAMGRPAYDAMLRDEQLLPFSGADVERMASDELAHGWTVQAWVEHLAQERHTPIGPSSGGGLAPGGPPLVDYYRERLAELAAFVTAQHVVTIPAWLGRIDVVETPKFLQPVSPGASMDAPLLFSRSTTGFYYITPPKSLADAASRLDPNEDFDRDRILSTGAHEAMPGHFLQLSIARRNPDFVRKIQDSGVFAEGWAFYGEEMFVNLGLFADRLDGRYYTAQWERVRGARATVDPKLASGEWSYDRAVTFFEREAGFPEDAAKAQVASIALHPGYFISYTVGRYQLEALLAAYRERLGDRASLLDFHDRLLCYVTTPFAVVAPELLDDLDKPVSAVMSAANY
jgi:uncharacterized protein (DUF885 family)